ncbi:hypothetical protein [Marinomonas algicola]|uniref:hypothetical protein n=1 Tax=Marinomonas algicola TaxID=2773454 RepID=UPI00174E48C2|nr:hypothetical protein [Marinomonas algicola]
MIHFIFLLLLIFISSMANSDDVNEKFNAVDFFIEEKAFGGRKHFLKWNYPVGIFFTGELREEKIFLRSVESIEKIAALDIYSISKNKSTINVLFSKKHEGLSGFLPPYQVDNFDYNQTCLVWLDHKQNVAIIDLFDTRPERVIVSVDSDKIREDRCLPEYLARATFFIPYLSDKWEHESIFSISSILEHSSEIDREVIRFIASDLVKNGDHIDNLYKSRMKK